MVNMPLYRLLDVEVSAEQLRAEFALDWFAHYALSSDLLESELLDALVGRSDSEVQAVPLRLPLRDALLGQAGAVGDFHHRLCVGGPVALFAVARPASWSHQAAHQRVELLAPASRRSRYI
jgi:hypothetical protein